VGECILCTFCSVLSLIEGLLFSRLLRICASTIDPGKLICCGANETNVLLLVCRTSEPEMLKHQTYIFESRHLSTEGSHDADSIGLPLGLRSGMRYENRAKNAGTTLKRLEM